MCFHSQQHKSPEEIAKRFHLDLKQIPHLVTGTYNGFDFPETPVISNEDPSRIELYHWGLIPTWSKTDEIKKFTLNAKIETLSEKPSFKDNTLNRCLILSDGFFEWQWRDSKGKNKQKFFITTPDKGLFTFAGIWSDWTNPHTGISQKTYSILTTKANELMSEIHNSKKRMPVILPQKLENDWLSEMPIEDFRYLDVDLIAEKIGGQPSLFD